MYTGYLDIYWVCSVVPGTEQGPTDTEIQKALTQLLPEDAQTLMEFNKLIHIYKMSIAIIVLGRHEPKLNWS